MKTVVFTYTKGWNDTLEEEFEFEDNATDDEISKEFEQWVWEQIGDYVNWYEKE